MSFPFKGLLGWRDYESVAIRPRYSSTHSSSLSLSHPPLFLTLKYFVVIRLNCDLRLVIELLGLQMVTWDDNIPSVVTASALSVFFLSSIAFLERERHRQTDRESES